MDDNTLFIHDNLQIPLTEFDVRFSTSSGPGGQHANRSATRVILSFNVKTSLSLSENDRTYLLKKLASQLTNDGILQIHVQDSRSQHRNRELALERMQFILQEGLKRPKKRKRTKPSRAMQERRLEKKRQNSEKKSRRRWRWD